MNLFFNPYLNTMNERRFERQSQPITREQVIDVLSNITTVEDSRHAAQVLGKYLEGIDTSGMERIDKIRIEGVRTHCQKPEAEVDDGQRYIDLLNKYLQEAK